MTTEVEVAVYDDPNPLLRRLQAMDAVQLAGLLEAAPGLVDIARSRGPLPYGQPSAQGAGPSLPMLARVLITPMGLHLLQVGLDAFTLQLAELAAWHGGTLTREQLLAETDGRHAEALERAAATLRERLLAEEATGEEGDGHAWLVLRPSFARRLDGADLRIRDWLRHLHRDDLGVLAANLGAVDVPAKHGRRMALIEHMLRRRDVLDTVIAGLPEESWRLLDRLVREGPQRVRDLGIDYVTPRSYHASPGAPLLLLRDHALVDIDFGAQTCAVWSDVRVGFAGGRRFGAWPADPPAPSPAPLVEGPARVPPVVEHLDALLRMWGTEPAEALANGGLGVRPVRAAAKRLGLAAGEVGLLAHLAIRLGVLGQLAVGTKGRGRAATTTYQWTTTRLHERFADEPAAARWARLVQVWRDDPDLDEGEGLPERSDDAVNAGDGFTSPLSRSALLDLLAELPEGTGLDVGDLHELAAWRRPLLLDPRQVDGLVAAARVLGLIPASGPVGLTTAAHALREGVDALLSVLPEGRRELVVQADLTVITPPDAEADLLGELARYAEVESDAGARVWRLSEARITRALDDRTEIEDVERFLREHATAELPQNITYLLTDIGRRHGRVRAGTATSYLRCDDPALLAAAVAVRAAKLRLLAPTVAVSPLARSKLVTALRDKGVSVVAEDADGATITTQAKTAEPLVERRHGQMPELPALREGEADLLGLARAMLDQAPVAPQPPAGHPRRDDGRSF